MNLFNFFNDFLVALCLTEFFRSLVCFMVVVGCFVLVRRIVAR